MRIKDVVEIRNDKTADTSMPYVALENIVSWDAKFVESNSETEGINNVFKDGDILFGKLRPYLAKGFIPTYDGICSTEFFVMKAKKGYDANYLLKVFLSHSFIDYIKNQVSGVKMPRTSWDVFGSISIDIPPFPIQQHIVSYLDAKTSEIDRKISLLEKKRDAYLRLKTATINHAVTRGLNPDAKLKNSGVEWIGLVPEHWEVKRVKELCGFVSRGAVPDYVDESSFLVMNQAVFSSGKVDYDVVRYSSYMKPESIIIKNDLLIASTGGGVLGKLLYYDDEKTDFYADTHVTVLRSKKDVFCMKFLFYLLSTRFEMINCCLAKGSTNQTELQRDKLVALEIGCPSIDEQISIVSYLDDKCNKIDAVINTIEKQIDAYKRLKRSLINEVVTGQRTV